MDDNPDDQRHDTDDKVAPVSGGDRANAPAIKDSTGAREKWKCRLQWGNAIVGTLTLFAVVWYASVASKQLLVMERQWLEAREANKIALANTRLAQESAKASEKVAMDIERPWLGVSRIDLLPLGAGKIFGAKLTFLNSGKTPAIDIISRTGFGILVEIPKVINIPGPWATPITIFPGVDFLVMIASDKPLSSEQVQAIAAGTLRFYIAGNVVYQDRFGRRHETDFCGYYNPNVGLFSTCAAGNSAT